jgi:hypothetical protein
MCDDDTPFKNTRTQTIFKNAANVTLRGSTFDATHMDKFLGSGFGERQLTSGFEDRLMPTTQTGRYTNRTIGPGGGGGSNLMSYLASSTSQIRPSVSFIGLTREETAKQNHLEKNDGPSPMQILGNEQAFKDKNANQFTYYEKERFNHVDGLPENVKHLKEARNMLYSKDLDEVSAG